MIYLCVTPGREEKTGMLMRGLQRGFIARRRECRIVKGAPPDDADPFVVWGQEWLALEIIPRAYAEGRPFWHIDNGFWRPGRGSPHGYYRFTYRSMTPRLLPVWLPLRVPRVVVRPWRHYGNSVLLAMPGPTFGLALGIDVKSWCETIFDRLRQTTRRQILVRPRNSRRPLSADLDADLWALVTHSSNVAVDAVLAGIPVFVAPTSPAAPVGRLDLDIEHPMLPDRDHWLSSLHSQHFTVPEMEAGTAALWMDRIERLVDLGVRTTAGERKELQWNSSL